MSSAEKVATKKRKQKEHYKCQKVSTEEIKQGLTVNSGFESLTAVWLGELKTAQKKAQYELLGKPFDNEKDKVTISRQAISKRIQMSETLKKHKEDIDESVLDLAEKHLIKLVLADDLGAICFLLKCKGKKRGYIERQEITGADGSSLSPVELNIAFTDKGD
ncbi:hypothetical protein [Synergistes jonesii]|uniref:Uncharacterized protein n=1 Tax=Synergistes jonesii TaxID=2754 RepID=A0A073IQD7_9BACT|nr:hypothetical protein [Synergistes jonesii]KEJ91701.1 hypothetical protein EH55_06910 [Synergistes jonesii]MDY2985892.1 hypothetical protein [Synergistes jonesii]OFB61774.1 hypothetical protein JS73_09025 [Synergistes jonesii]OFB64134.1 hypothetical protein JS72_05440 [Synergistes jonesii]OFB67275.1 hypothetical protein JS78_09035 [Synergistes jonesii]